MKPSVLISLLLISTMLMGNVMALEQPKAWMEPEHPTDKDHISIYCKAPGAYDVQFNVCADNGTVCFMLMNQTKIDSETWKVDVYGTLKAGTKAHYEVTVVYQNETTGNEGYKHLGPVHFTVESAPTSSGNNTPSIGAIMAIGAVTVSALAWGYVRREE